MAEHPGNVWTNVISLQREDAARLGYDNLHAWQALLRSQRNEILHIEIPPEQPEIVCGVSQ
ncbi:hypothetical protein [Paenibacillus durus]|uniref:hypothetical protein n=1 Tax=Paenibacillus durus TaxID=44251 RepID=UPI000AAB2574|nr:hypothetical protein [Paenibacillus durus]